MKIWTLSFLVSLSVFASADYPKFKGPEKEFRCWKKMKGFIDDLKPQLPWKNRLSRDMSASYLAPTAQLSRWVRVFKDNQNNEYASRETPYDRLLMKFDSKCTASVRMDKHPHPMKGFTDVDLAKAVQSSPEGLIYSWSPKMSHSLTGLKNIQAVAASMKIPLFIVMDPYADEKSAVEALDRAGLTKTPIRKIASMELINRDSLVHFPNLLMFKNGKMVKSLYPGVMAASDYRHVINQHLRK